MTTLALSPIAGAGSQWFDDNGDPLAGGYLYTYTAGTTTPATTYTVSSGTTANTNPIVLDAAGRVPEEVWISPSAAYKFVLQDTTHSQVWAKDGITVYTPVDPTANLANASNIALGDAMVAFKQANTSGVLAGAVAKTVHDKLREFVSVLDFGADPTGATDCSAAIVAATASGRQVTFPPGTYLISTRMAFGGLDGVEWRGTGRDVSVIKFDSGVTWTDIGIYWDACSNLRITDLGFDEDGAVFADGAELFAAMQIAADSGDADNIAVDNCKFENSYFIGLSLWRTRYFEVSSNWFYRAPSALDTGQHYCLNASCFFPDPANPGQILQSGTILRDGLITGNRFYNSGVAVAGWNIAITDNICETNTYGAGIATFDRVVNTASLDPTWIVGSYTVTGNICSDGQGVDADLYEVCGMEIGGPYSVCAGNTCYNNGGQGIRWFSYQGVCANNVCYNNGTAGGASKGAYTQAGITAYQTAGATRAHYGCNYSLITGNICYDTGGGNQLYGYSENTPVTPSLVGMNVAGNKVTENATGTGYLIASAANNSYDFDQWDTYTPTFGAGGGALGAVSATTGRYMRRGGVCFFNITATIAIGTATTYLTVTLPVASINDSALSISTFSGADVTSPKAITLVGQVQNNSATAKVFKYEGSFPFTGTADIVLTGHYTISAVG